MSQQKNETSNLDERETNHNDNGNTLSYQQEAQQAVHALDA
jgi:hypothetical protein